jgi:hypothetical protein
LLTPFVQKVPAISVGAFVRDTEGQRRIQLAECRPVGSADEALAVLAEGERTSLPCSFLFIPLRFCGMLELMSAVFLCVGARHYGTTDRNIRSSRSHTIVRVVRAAALTLLVYSSLVVSACLFVGDVLTFAVHGR